MCRSKVKVSFWYVGLLFNKLFFLACVMNAKIFSAVSHAILESIQFWSFVFVILKLEIVFSVSINYLYLYAVKKILKHNCCRIYVDFLSNMDVDNCQLDFSLFKRKNGGKWVYILPLLKYFCFIQSLSNSNCVWISAILWCSSVVGYEALDLTLKAVGHSG